MKYFSELKAEAIQKNSRLLSEFEAYDEPHRTKALRWFKTGKVTLAVGAAKMAGYWVADIALGFVPQQQQLQEQLGNIEDYTLIGGMALMLTVVGNIGLAEVRANQIKSERTEI